MFVVILLLSSCVVLAASGRSPNADYVEELLWKNAFGSRISDSVIEDALLDVVSFFLCVHIYVYPKD